jgi:uncharacterized protein with HEPN domain
MSERTLLLYLTDIEDAITAIFEYTDDISFSQFEKDKKTREAVVLNLIIIGEAIKKLPKEIIGKFPDIPWKEFAGMRDKLVHSYFQMSPVMVWATIQDELPALSTAIGTIRSSA